MQRDLGVSMIRYRFETFDQLVRHLHTVENTTLVFVPDERRQPLSGRAVLELQIGETHEQTVVRGEVVARSEGSMPGAWLQLGDTRLARHLTLRRAFAARREQRLSADHVVQLTAESGSQLVQLLDVSASGARIRGSRGLPLGSSWALRLLGGRRLDAELGQASVLRAEGAEVALRFANPTAPGLQQFLRALQQSWQQAREICHSPDCCGSRGPLEPLIPRNLKARA